MAPTIESNDADVFASSVEYRKSYPGEGEWYVTWVNRVRPWEVSVMRLAGFRDEGRAWHHGRSVSYRADWSALSASASTAERTPDSAIPFMRAVLG